MMMNSRLTVPHGTRALWLLILALLAILLGPATSRAVEPPAKINPDAAFFALTLDDFFPVKLGKLLPRLNLYMVRRDGKWISAVGTATYKGSPNWNTALMPADPSKLTLTAEKLSGTVPITFVPDPWVPADQKARTGTITVDATFVPSNSKEAVADAMGTWSIVMDGPEEELRAANLPVKASGKLGGGIGGTAVPDIADASYDLMCFNLLPGDPKDAFVRRRVINLGIKDGKVISARSASVDNMQNATGYQPLPTPDPTAVTVTPDTLAGTINFPISGADGESLAYTLSFEGKRTANWIAGTWKATYINEDAPAGTKPGEISGYFRGNVWRGAAQPLVVDKDPWFVPVKDFVAPAPGEHPRLLFRKADLPKLRERAKTSAGQAIVKRLRETLNGSDGETMPRFFNASTAAYAGNKAVADDSEKADAKVDTTDAKVVYTIGHAAGYGMLYQLTGEKKYADLGRQCFEKAFEGVRDRDDRYAWKNPGGGLRAGPSVGIYALGYDLCYDGWDPDFRQKVAAAIMNYEQGHSSHSLAALARGTHQFPGSNHWGAQVGGGALALLAIKGDPGTDDARVNKLLEASSKCMVRNVTEGFGDHGWFMEGDGPGSIASDTAFIPAIEAWRVAAGKDFVAARINFQWMTMKWVMLTLPVQTTGKAPFPTRGGYAHNVWSRRGTSGSGTFCQGFGAVTEEQKPALLWLYNHTYKTADENAGQPCDTVSPYPHRAAIALVNWPIGMEEKNPATVLPKAVGDKLGGFYMFRNRWQDGNDCLITALTKHSKGNGGVGGGPVFVWGLGHKVQFPMQVMGNVKSLQASDTGGVLAMGDRSFGVDFSKASGAEALIVLATAGDTGAAALPAKLEPGVFAQTLKAGKYTYVVQGITSASEPPAISAVGDAISVGKQTVSYDGTQLSFGR